MRRFELKIFTKAITIEANYVEVYANNFENAKEEVKEGNYEYLDSKTIDIQDEQIIDEEDWELISEEPLDTGSDTKEHN